MADEQKRGRLVRGLLRIPNAERARGATQHRLGNLLQLSTDIAASLPRRMAVMPAPIEVQLDIAEAMVDQGIVPVFGHAKR